MPYMTTEDFELPRSARGGLGDPDRCDRCAGQYAYVAGAQVAGKRARTILACGSCGQPAPADHPEQIKLARQWDERDARDRAEVAQHQKSAEQASRSPYQHVGMLAQVEEGFARLERLLLAQAEQIKALSARVQALENRPRK